MSTPVNAIFFAPLRQPVTDPSTGLITREWYLFFQALFNRVGGSVAPSTDDISQSIPLQVDTGSLALGTSDVLQQLLSLPPSQIPPASDLLVLEINDLREQVAELYKEIQAFKQLPVI